MRLDGNDTLNGGVGADTCTATPATICTSSTTPATGRSSTGGTDTVQSGVTFSLDSVDGQFIARHDQRLPGGHRQDLGVIDAVSGGVDDAFAFIGTAAFSGTAGELRQAASGGNAIVTGDVDGNGAGDFQILLIESHALNQTDFVL